MQDTEHDVEQLVAECAGKEPEALLRLAFSKFPDLAISCSGSEDVALVHMATRVHPGARVFCLDTGRLHNETLNLIEQMRKRYAITLDVLSPDAAAVEALVREKGLYSFYRDGHQECCAIRKVQPLARYLGGLRAWMTGLRRDQNPATRDAVPLVQLDHSLSSNARPLIKFNPLAEWTSAQVWEYIRAHDVPYNALHRQGYASIGCAPCTRPILPHQHEREGRWWWEQGRDKECGLHVDGGERGGTTRD